MPYSLTPTLNFFNYTSYTMYSYISNILVFITSINIFSSITLLSLPTNLLLSLSSNLSFVNFNQIYVKPKFLKSHVSENNNDITFAADNNSTTNTEEWSNTLLSETSNNLRFTRFQNPLISYDYKCGHYLGIWESLYPSLMTSYIEVARGIRKAP